MFILTGPIPATETGPRIFWAAFTPSPVLKETRNRASYSRRTAAHRRRPRIPSTFQQCQSTIRGHQNPRGVPSHGARFLAQAPECVNAFFEEKGFDRFSSVNQWESIVPNIRQTTSPTAPK